MALYAGDIFMCRILNVFFLNGEGDGLVIYRFCYIRTVVAFEAFCIRGSNDEICAADSMGLMAVRTCWNGSRFTFPKFALNDFCVDFFDPGMTYHARCGNITGRNGGFCIRMRKNEMISVAVIARSCYDQTLLEKPFSVNTL